MSKYLIMTTNSDGDVTYIKESVAVAPKPLADERIIERSEGALAGLTGPELVSVFNALVPKAEGVERFADKRTGAKRVLAAWDAMEAIPDVPPTPVVQKKVKLGKTPNPKAGRPGKTLAGTLHVVPGKCEGKVWKKASARYAAFKVIEAETGLTVERYTELIGANAQSLLAQVLKTGCVELRE